MNYHKRKQQENYNKTWFPKKEQYNPYANDPPDAKCPYCGLSRKPCSHVNGLSRAWARGSCKKKNSNK
jgi:hypothetical protein